MVQPLSKSLLLFISFILFVGCQNDIEDVIQPQVDETLIVYMAAENNLRSNAIDNIYGMIEGLAEGQRVIVFLDKGDDSSYLLQLDNPTTNSFYEEKVKTYPNRNSGSPSVLYNILSDIVKHYPSKTYDLILWSHGTSWLPSNRVKTKSFALDQTSSIDIHELEMALPIRFRSIIFDACLMGSVEVISQLKDKARYIVASPTDVLSSGLPYNEIIPILLDKNTPILERLKLVCDSYYSHYSQMSNSILQSASITIYDPIKISSLQDTFKKIIQAQPEVHVSSNSALALHKDYPCFDFMDMVTNNYGPNAYNQLNHHLQELIVYEKHTPRFLGSIDLTNLCGINCFIPTTQNHIQESYYKTLYWGVHTDYDKAIFPF
ncbi:clostripain-related cysteine peptidase [Prolixibacteraceae bacterium]|nr:clostripain-related cysteine peptidase [Prolixibacteraceae bacterium]